MRSLVQGPGTLFSLTLLALLGSCARTTVAPRGDRNFITPQEVESAEVSNAHELIQQLRPLWLRSRGGRSVRLETEIVVYVNGSMIGGIDALTGIPIEVISSVRALDAAEAGRLPGLGSRHVERAIMVETRSVPAEFSEARRPFRPRAARLRAPAVP